MKRQEVIDAIIDSLLEKMDCPDMADYIRDDQQSFLEDESDGELIDRYFDELKEEVEIED